MATPTRRASSPTPARRWWPVALSASTPRTQVSSSSTIWCAPPWTIGTRSRLRHQPPDPTVHQHPRRRKRRVRQHVGAAHRTLRPTGTTLLASGTVGSDGRNEALNYIASAAGTYLVRVTSRSRRRVSTCSTQRWLSRARRNSRQQVG